MSTHDSGLRDSQHAHKMDVDTPSGDASSKNVQDSSAQEMEDVTQSRPADTYERYVENSAAYYAYFDRFLPKEVQEQERINNLAVLQAIQTEALTSNRPAPDTLPPKNYFKNMPTPQVYPALIKLSAAAQHVGALKAPKERIFDIRVQFDSGREATPRIDIILKITNDGKASPMDRTGEHVEVRLRCNAGYRGNAQGGIDSASWSYSSLEDGIAGGLSSQEAFNCAKQVAMFGGFESKHFWRLTFNCKNAHIVDKRKRNPLPVIKHDLFKLFNAAGGNQTITIYWVCKATNLMENILRHIHLAIEMNWAPYYVYPRLPIPLDMSKPSAAWSISDIAQFYGGMWGRDVKATASGKGKGPATTNEQPLHYKTAPLRLSWPDEQEYGTALAVSQYREHQYSYANSNRLAGASSGQRAWVVSGARFHKYAQEHLEEELPKTWRNRTSTREAVIKEYFFIFVAVDKSDATSRDTIPTSGSYTFKFQGTEAQQETDEKTPWTGAVTAINPEDKERADFVVLVKKPKGARYLPAFNSLKEAQDSHPGYPCRLYAKANIKIAERELLAVQHIVRGDRPDLNAFRQVLLHGTCKDLEFIDGTKNPYVPQDGDRSIDFRSQEDFRDLLFDLQNSNPPQQSAVKMVFHIRGGVTLIVGPPGTGKTDTLAVIVFLGVKYGHKALVCAASNDAVNRLFQGLLDLEQKLHDDILFEHEDWSKFIPMRLYVPEAEFEHVQRPRSHQNLDVGSTDNDADDDEDHRHLYKLLRSFEDKTWGEYHRLTSPHYAHPQHSLGAAIMRRMDDDFTNFQRKYPAGQVGIEDMTESERTKEDPSYKLREVIGRYHNLKDGKMDFKELKKLRFLYTEQCYRVINDANIIATTNNNAGCNLLERYNPTLVVVDEAAQSTEASALVPTTRWSSTLLRVFIGDEKQLQPTVTSRAYNEFYPQMFMSLFERLRKREYELEVQLTVQYRMCPDISDFLIQNIYHHTLTNGPTLSTPRPIEVFIKNFNLREFQIPRAFVMLDVPYGRGIVEANSTSFVNHANVALIRDLVRNLLAGMGDVRPLSTSKIQVLSYYDAQRRALHDMFRTMGTDEFGNTFSDIEIKTVDSSQGSQCSVIIVDTVCNIVQTMDANQQNLVSAFLRSLNRVNVSLSRAMDGLYVVGSLVTLKAGAKDKNSTGDILPLLANYVEANHLVYSLENYGDIPSAPGPSDPNYVQNRERAIQEQQYIRAQKKARRN